MTRVGNGARIEKLWFNKESLTLTTEEGGERGGGVGREHEAGADEEGVVACVAKLEQFGVGADAGFADGDAVVGNFVDEFERSFYANVERFEIAIVDADDFRTGM